MKLSFNTFIDKTCKIHNNKYDYFLAKDVYKNTLTKIPILCNTHGVFYQSPKSHLKGAGCKKSSLQDG